MDFKKLNKTDSDLYYKIKFMLGEDFSESLTDKITDLVNELLDEYTDTAQEIYNQGYGDGWSGCRSELAEDAVEQNY